MGFFNSICLICATICLLQDKILNLKYLKNGEELVKTNYSIGFKTPKNITVQIFTLKFGLVCKILRKENKPLSLKLSPSPRSPYDRPLRKIKKVSEKVTMLDIKTTLDP